MKTIKKAKIVKKVQNGFEVKFKPTKNNKTGIIFLTGINRPKNVKIGDVGTLTYSNNGCCGLWWWSSK